LLAPLGAVLVLVPHSLGSYGDAKDAYHYPIRAAGHWLLTNASLLPFSFELVIVPGALLGLGYELVRPRLRLERAVAAVTVTTAILCIAQSACA
jgi:hypothetical protein